MAVVVCRLEYMPYLHTKLVLALNYAALLCSLVGMGLLVALKFGDDGCVAGAHTQHNDTPTRPFTGFHFSATTCSHWPTPLPCPSPWLCSSQRYSFTCGTCSKPEASNGAKLCF